MASNSISNEESSGSICGSLNYLAPEIAKKEKYSNKVDIFSLGACLISIITKLERTLYLDLLLHEKETFACIHKDLQEKLPEDEWLVQLICQMIAVDPKDRPSADKILEYLENSDKKSVMNSLLGLSSATKTGNVDYGIGSSSVSNSIPPIDLMNYPNINSSTKKNNTEKKSSTMTNTSCVEESEDTIAISTKVIVEERPSSLFTNTKSNVSSGSLSPGKHLPTIGFLSPSLLFFKADSQNFEFDHSIVIEGCTPEHCLSVIKDFEQYPKFVPNIISATILPNKDHNGNIIHCEYCARYGLLKICYEMRHEITFNQKTIELSWQAISGGPFSMNVGKWKLSSIEQGCLAVYTMSVRFSYFVPESICKFFLQQPLINSINAFKTQIKNNVK